MSRFLRGGELKFAPTLFAAAMLIVAANAFAQKTDVVTLRNGDRMTCEVKELSRGQLKLSTDDMGTIYVEWDKVVSVRTTNVFEIVTTTGGIYFGMLGADSGNLLVVRADGSSTPLYFLEVVSFARIKSGFWGRIDGSLEIGGSYTQSSGVGQLSTGFAMTYRRPGYEVFTNFDSNLTTQEEAETTTRINFSTGYRHQRKNRWVISPFAYVERNPDLGLTVRGAGALAIGRYVYQSSRNYVLVTGGFSAGVEQPVEGEAVNDFDALVSLTSSFNHYDYPKRNLDLSLIMFPSLSDWGRVRANAELKVNQEVVRDFFASISVYNIYDSRPVVEDANLNDFGLTFSIGWTF